MLTSFFLCKQLLTKESNKFTTSRKSNEIKYKTLSLTDKISQGKNNMIPLLMVQLHQLPSQVINLSVLRKMQSDLFLLKPSLGVMLTSQLYKSWPDKSSFMCCLGDKLQRVSNLYGTILSEITDMTKGVTRQTVCMLFFLYFPQFRWPHLDGPIVF